MATPTATAAPAMVTSSTRASDSTVSWIRLMPSVRRIGNSAASSISWRYSSCATTARAMRPASAAKMARAIACGRICPLGRGVVGGQMDDLDAADPVPGGQRSGLAGESGRVSPGPEHDVAAAAGRVERLGQPAAGERRAQQHARRAQLPGGGHDLVVGDHDGRHPEGQPHRMADALGTAALRVAEQVQRATRLDVRPLGQALADHDCVLVSRVGQVPGQHLDPVDGPALAARRAGLGHQAGERRSARAGQRHLQEGHRIGRCHLRQGGHRPEVAVKPGLRRAHQQVRRAAAAQETGISGVGAPCAGRRGQHHPADQADEQHQAQHRGPALPQVGAQGEPGRCHGKIQLHQATWRQGW